MEERTDAPYWIYDKENNMFPEYGEFFKKIEKALGFELFTWQKHLSSWERKGEPGKHFQ